MAWGGINRGDFEPALLTYERDVEVRVFGAAGVGLAESYSGNGAGSTSSAICSRASARRVSRCAGYLTAETAWWSRWHSPEAARSAALPWRCPRATSTTSPRAARSPAKSFSGWTRRGRCARGRRAVWVAQTVVQRRCALTARLLSCAGGTAAMFFVVQTGSGAGSTTTPGLRPAGVHPCPPRSLYEKAILGPCDGTTWVLAEGTETVTSGDEMEQHPYRMTVVLERREHRWVVRMAHGSSPH